MLSTDTTLINAYKSNSRELRALMTVYGADAIEYDDNLIKFDIERGAPMGKMFGFAVSQKIKVEVLREYKLTPDYMGNPLIRPTIQILIDGKYKSAKFPNFYIEDIEVDETENKSVITGYDIVSLAERYTVNELSIEYPTNLYKFVDAIATKIGLGFNNLVFDDVSYFTGFEITEPPNFAGTETLKEVLDAIAEASGTICYSTMSPGQMNTQLAFRKLTSAAQDEINGSQYFEFATHDDITLTKITSTNQLSDAIHYGSAGYEQALWDNPFLTMREDLPTLLETLGDKVIGTTITPFTMKWRGNPVYELSDYIKVKTLSGAEKTVYLFNSSLVYDGGLYSEASWEATKGDNITSGPTTLGAAIGQTYAKVDKVNHKIDLVASEVADNTKKISSIEMTTDNITARVDKVETIANTTIDGMREEVANISNRVSTTITSENLSIEVQKEIAATGVDKVTTKTGFTFDEVGLTIDKSGSEMTTTITEDGMTIYRSESPVLVANNIGVKATNLHSTTYLLIGANSRLENYNTNRTGCFWVGMMSEVE